MPSGAPLLGRRPVGHQQLHGRRAARAGGQVQRRPALVVHRVHLRAAPEQRLERVEVAVQRGEVQRPGAARRRRAARAHGHPVGHRALACGAAQQLQAGGLRGRHGAAARHVPRGVAGAVAGPGPVGRIGGATEAAAELVAAVVEVRVVT